MSERMNDYERARWLLPEGTDEVEVRELAACLDEARREGAAEMRERAAELAEVHWGAGASFIAEDIRALPLAPEEP